MTLEEIGRLSRLSRLLKQQADIESLKLPIKGKSNVHLDLIMYVDGRIDSINIADLNANQIFDIINYISSTNEKIINEFKPVIMGHISDKEE